MEVIFLLLLRIILCSLVDNTEVVKVAENNFEVVQFIIIIGTAY